MVGHRGMNAGFILFPSPECPRNVTPSGIDASKLGKREKLGGRFRLRGEKQK
jgi:hypothetical protein